MSRLMGWMGRGIGIVVLAMAGCSGTADRPPTVEEIEQAETSTCPLGDLDLGGDHWGCDVIDNIGYFFSADPNSISNSSKGQCCDRHDAELSAIGQQGIQCSGNPSDPPWIIAIGCIVSGWSPICDDPCVSIHVRVANCFLHEDPGPSICAQWGVCGYNRNIHDKFGCVADSMCSPGTMCNCSTGVCTCLGCCELTPPPQCGPYNDDCGFPHDAGPCPEGYTCQYGGCAQVCSAIVPQCGGYYDSCGNYHPGNSCPAGFECQGGGCVQVCTATPPQCGGYFDSCGNYHDGASCPDGWDCQGGICVQVCTAFPPQCGGYYDSCGNYRDAGPCPGGYECIGGACQQTSYCGDGQCGAGEDCYSCAYDCGECYPTCGNGWCEAGEEQGGWYQCCSDCWCDSCGDGYCEYWGDECYTCWQDCGWSCGY
jgi:hypothetical protein